MTHDSATVASVQRAATAGFFDSHPVFYQTGNTPAGPRLNARYDCLIGENLAHIRGRRVLDLGSHDGRWSFAALASGASHVIGIEPRRELVKAAERNLLESGIPRERFEFHVGDALETIIRLGPDVDTVFVFGVLYHVHYHVALVRELWKTGASIVLVDTHVIRDGEDAGSPRVVRFLTERVDSISTAADEIFPGAGTAIIGHPSRAFVRFLFESFQFDVSELPWQPHLARWGTKGLKDYAEGSRSTFVATRSTQQGAA